MLPWAILTSYGILYSGLPDYRYLYRWDHALVATAASVILIGAATLFASWRQLAEKPASLMRPQAPVIGKKILLERIGILWKPMPFTWKATFRNLFRYKKRFFMTVFGIGGCMGLLLTGFGLRDSIMTIARYQFTELFHYEVTVTLTEATSDEEELSQMLAELTGEDHVENAMAIRLNPKSFGQIVDYFDGQDDIRNKRIRTLHALSFVEDPTRMFRAVRFEQRYGFRLGMQCERFMRNAIDDLHLVDHLSGGRITHELELMMEEHNPYLCFRRLDELGILGNVHPLLRLDDEKRSMADRIRRVLEWYMHMYLPVKPDMLVLMLIALCRKVQAVELEAILKRLKFSEKRIRYALQVRSFIISARLEMARWEKMNGSLRDLHRILSRAPLESMLYLLAKEDQSEQHEKLTRYIYLGREMKADITGDDLLELGIKKGPMIGRILDEILGAKMENPNLDRRSQLQMAEAYMRQSYQE